MNKRAQIQILMNPAVWIVAVIAVVGVVGFNYLSEHSPGEIIPSLTEPKYPLQYFESKEALKTEIAYLDKMQLHDGQCFRNWQPIDLSYEHADCISAQIEAFEVTGDIKYLNEARDNLNNLYARANDCKDPSKAWAGHTDTIGDGFIEFRCMYPVPVDHLQPARLMIAFARYVDIVKKRNVQDHMADAEKFQKFVTVDHFNDIKSTWYEYEVTLADGTKEERGCYGSMTNGKISCNNNNRVAQEYDILLYSYEWTKDQKFKDIYEKWARRFKAALIVKQDTPHIDSYYFWHYHDDDPDTTADYNPCDSDPSGWLCSGPAELGAKGYTNFDIMPIIHGYKLGISWNKRDMILFANGMSKAAGSLKGNAYTTDGVLLKANTPIIGTYVGMPSKKDWTNEFVMTSKSFAWIDFALVDKSIYPMFEEIYFNEYYYQKSKGDFWKSTFYQCVGSPLIDVEKPICSTEVDGVNPIWRMWGLVKLLKYAQ